MEPSLGSQLVFCPSFQGIDLGDHKHPTSETPSFSSLKIHFWTITDMQDKYCGNCYSTMFTLFKAFGRATSFVVSFVLALNHVNIVAVTTILVLHVGNGRSEHM